ncbi:hybrid sensor histidine kinase/response regulator [Cohaesibacter intestini]|uniref:hybrid sensor histidine kinase/response regulator n=1 Tax=Cohaesibacter intestini TaxID=2211145 RepID=UPI000DE952D4|nr:hybrid sensor histidine kinase/response regulator [Cohaesibacter intestini]
MEYKNQENVDQTREVDSFHHDLRTQLSAIVSLSTLIRKSRNPANCTALLEALHLAANNAMAMMEDGAAMHEALPTASMQLVKLLKDFEQVASGLAEARGAHFRLVLDPALKSTAFASPDPTYFNRLFTLLLDNAIKYAPGSTITLSATIKEGNELALDFADDGPGFGVADPSLLFEPYQRGTSSEGVAGSGLGLWSVKTIVEMMHGKIWAAANKPTGAVFFVRLPLDVVATAPLPEDKDDSDTKATTEDGLGFAGLIVDDNATNQLIISELLKAMGCATSHASSGEEALTRLASEQATDLPDFMLLDIRMEGMDGWELAGRIRDNKAWDAMPLIAVSSDPTPAALAPFDGWMQRPIDPERLQSMLSDLVKS